MSKSQLAFLICFTIYLNADVRQFSSSVAPLKSLYFHWTAICSSSIVFTPRSLFLLFVLQFWAESEKLPENASHPRSNAL